MSVDLEHRPIQQIATLTLKRYGVPLALLAGAMSAAFVTLDRSFASDRREMTLLGADSAMSYLRLVLDRHGSIRVDANGRVFVGELPLDGAQPVVEDVLRSTGYGATIFLGDLRVATTAKAAHRETGPAIGTRSAPEIAARVLGKRQRHRGVTRTIGREWVIIYNPLFGPNQQPVGMLATYQALDHVEDTMARFRGILGLSLLAVFALTTGLLVLNARAQLATARLEEQQAKLALQRRLSETEARRLAVFETSQDGILVLDEEHQIVSANPAAHRILEADSLAGISLSEFVTESVSEFRDERRRETTGVRRGGERFFMELAVVSLSAAGEVGYTALLRDVTATVEARQELERARDKALAASRAKAAFLANMSHELRTPMNGVVGSIELLLDGPVESAHRPALEDARTSARRLLEIFDDILEVSRLDTERFSENRTRFAPRQLISDLCALYRETAEHKGLEFSSRLEFGHQTVSGDRARIRQLLCNLLNNAVKFTKRGEVEVEARTRTCPTQGTLLEVAIRDTGIGIESAQIGSLFNPFVQVESSLSREFGGVGLGLAISHRIAERLGGSLTAKSEPGVGSTFTFVCPLAEVKSQLEQTSPLKLQGQVMLAEDNVVNQRITRKMVERMGCQIEVAPDGEEALALANTKRFDVILMDIQMPKLNGYEVVEQIRRGDGPNRRTPIVALTANKLPEDRARALASGMNEHLGKPVNRSRLQAVLAEWMVQERCSA